MDINTETNTRYINSNMQGAPQITLTRGDLVKALKSVLVDGFNEQSIISISFDNITKEAVLNLPVNHGYLLNQVLLISGADNNIVNTYHRIFYVENTTVKIKIPNLDITEITGTLKAKVAPLGYDLVFNDIINSGTACFKNKSINAPAILKVIDALPPNGYDVNWARYARVVAGQAIDEQGNFINNEKFPRHTTFPDMEKTGNDVSGANGIHGLMKWDYGLYRTTSSSYAENASNNYGDYPTSWRIIGDDKTFYLMIKPMGRNYGQYNMLSFGSFDSFGLETTILTGSQRELTASTDNNGKSSVAWRMGFTYAHEYVGNFIFRNIEGSYNSWLNFTLFGMYFTDADRNYPSRSGLNPINPSTGKIFTSPLFIKDSNSDLRGKLRGIEQFYGIGKLTDELLVDNNTAIILTTKMYNGNWDSDENIPYVFSLKNWKEV